MTTHVILLMGGTSSRFKSDLPKQFQYLVGKRVYQHSLDTFLSFEQITTIVIVTHPQFVSMIKQENSDPRIIFANAGPSRQLSSKSGLQALKNRSGSVIIHDAARPLITKRIISDHIRELQTHKALNTCIPSADTIIVSNDGISMSHVPKRSTLMRGQTPQSFDLALITHAHATTAIEEATDDCQLVMETDSIHPHIIDGDASNIKITHDLDLTIAEHLLREPLPLPKQIATPFLEGKVFVVTGGMGGIGKAIIQALEMKGAKAICVSRSSPNYSCDLNDFNKTEQLFDKLYKRYGALDGLIHTVGSLTIAPFKSQSVDQIKHMIDTNLTSNLYAIACAKLKKGAHIVNFASSAFYRGRKNYALYSGAKAAIVNFTQGLALEHPEYYINVAVPYRTDTAMRKTNFPHEDTSLLLTPEEVANETLSILQSKLQGAVVSIKKRL